MNEAARPPTRWENKPNDLLTRPQGRVYYFHMPEIVRLQHKQDLAAASVCILRSLHSIAVTHSLPLMTVIRLAQAELALFNPPPILLWHAVFPGGCFHRLLAEIGGRYQYLDGLEEAEFGFTKLVESGEILMFPVAGGGHV